MPGHGMWSPGGGPVTGPSPGSGSSGTPGAQWGRGLKPDAAPIGKFDSFEDGDDDEDEGSQGGEGAPEDGKDSEAKKKSTRGSRACTVCSRWSSSELTKTMLMWTWYSGKLKMRCVGAEEGPPCKRCKSGGHEVRASVPASPSQAC